VGEMRDYEFGIDALHCKFRLQLPQLGLFVVLDCDCGGSWQRREKDDEFH
jgi:hypothetical protein